VRGQPVNNETIIDRSTGAKLAPFNSGVSARIALRKPMMLCSNFLFLATIFPKNVGERGGGVENIFSEH
jgi:hypothetical protein